MQRFSPIKWRPKKYQNLPNNFNLKIEREKIIKFSKIRLKRKVNKINPRKTQRKNCDHGTWNRPEWWSKVFCKI